MTNAAHEIHRQICLIVVLVLDRIPCALHHAGLPDVADPLKLCSLEISQTLKDSLPCIARC